MTAKNHVLGRFLSATTLMSALLAVSLFGPIARLDAQAQTSSSYSLQHNFWFWPGWWPIWPGQPAQWFVPTGYGSAWASASASAPGFPPAGQWQSAGNFMPPAWNVSANAVANSGSSHADAHGAVTLQPFGNWGLTLGTVRAWGNASASVPGGNANAFSSANFGLWGPAWWQWGWIRWQPWLQSSVSGSASASVPWPRRLDPILFNISDSSGNVTESGELMHIFLDGAGEGEFTWDENGLISINPSSTPGSSLIWEMDIRDLPGRDYIRDLDEGYLRLVFTGEVVTESYKTGRFATWAIPGVGHEGPAQLTGEMIDLGIDFGRPVDARIDFVTGVPEPTVGTLLLIACAGLSWIRLWRKRA